MGWSSNDYSYTKDEIGPSAYIFTNNQWRLVIYNNGKWKQIVSI